MEVRLRNTQRIHKRVIKHSQELFIFLNNPLIEPTNNQDKAAIEAKGYYEKDNFWQPLGFRRFQPCADNEYNSDGHLEWY